MKFSAYLSFVWVLTVCFDLLTEAIFSFNPLEYIFGAGSFAVRLIYILGGVGALFFVLFVVIYKPFRYLSK